MLADYLDRVAVDLNRPIQDLVAHGVDPETGTLSLDRMMARLFSERKGTTLRTAELEAFLEERVAAVAAEPEQADLSWYFASFG